MKREDIYQQGLQLKEKQRGENKMKNFRIKNNKRMCVPYFV